MLLYTQEDVGQQFGMSTRSRLTRPEIHGVLKALRNLDRRKRTDGEVVATSGEILTEAEDNVFERDSATYDTLDMRKVVLLNTVPLVWNLCQDIVIYRRQFPSGRLIVLCD